MNEIGPKFERMCLSRLVWASVLGIWDICMYKRDQHCTVLILYGFCGFWKKVLFPISTENVKITNYFVDIMHSFKLKLSINIILLSIICDSYSFRLI